jgi:hypothetical protein
MESIDEITKNNSNKKGFLKHIFNFDEESKEDMLNIIQYSLLALIPIIILNKAIQRCIPEADDQKGNIEIVAEILIQVIVLFLGILIIHRIITYFPTYSGTKYDKFSVTNIILAVLIIILSLQTKLGEKVSILIDRLIEIWDGNVNNNNNKENKKGKGQVKITQPIQQSNSNASSNQTTSLSLLPPPQMVSTPTNNSLPEYSNSSNNNMGSESIPTNMYENFAPMAANEVIGGSGFGASNW